HDGHSFALSIVGSRPAKRGKAHPLLLYAYPCAGRGALDRGISRSGNQQRATSRSMILYGLLMVAYVAYLAVWYPRRMRRRLFKCWETYDLEIGRDYLLRRQSEIPDLRLQFDEVQAVEHVQGRYLRVIGKTKSRAISIPESIDHFDQVLETVSSLQPVRRRTIEQWQKYRVFMAAGLLIFMLMLWATSPVVVIPLSLAMGSVIVWVVFTDST